MQFCEELTEAGIAMVGRATGGLRMPKDVWAGGWIWCKLGLIAITVREAFNGSSRLMPARTRTGGDDREQ